MSRKCMTDCAAREYVTAYVNTLETMICRHDLRQIRR